MKIALIGAHKTGKTTVFDLLKDELDDFHFISELIQNFNFKTASYYHYMYIQEQVLEEQLMKEDWAANTICDRSTLDNLSYMIASYVNHQYSNYKTALAHLIQNSTLVTQSIKNFSTYDHLFYCPIIMSVKDPSSDLSSGDIEYQETVDQIINYLLKQYHIPYVTLTGSPETRVQQILEEIKWKQ